MTVIDVHTHMLTRDYLDLLVSEGAPQYEMGTSKVGEEIIRMWGAPFMTLTDPMWDYDPTDQGYEHCWG